MTNSTAYLRILEEETCDPDKANNFGYFADTLALWASQYIPEIMAPIAIHAEELFEIAAVRVLLGKWHDAYVASRKHTRFMFKSVAHGDMEDVLPDEFISTYRSDLVAFNTALYALIVAK